MAKSKRSPRDRPPPEEPAAGTGAAREEEGREEVLAEEAVAEEAVAEEALDPAQTPVETPVARPDPAREDVESAARAIEEGLEEEVAAAVELAAELEDLRDRHLRLAAEFDNYRKRTRQELLKTDELGKARLTERLLDALDDLRRIAETPEEATTVGALHEGVALVERKVMKELREAGLRPIDAQGRRFDPNLHEALSAIATHDPAQDERVSRVFVRGYLFGDRLLRPARVEVMKYSSESAGSSGGGEGGRAGSPGDDEAGEAGVEEDPGDGSGGEAETGGS
ncbi:MAG: nucleotide exchange factor GrpE [Gemmatimonadota bacterium]